MDVQVRVAGQADAEIIALLGRLTFTETFGHLFESHQADLRAYLDKTFGVAKIASGLGQARNTFWLAYVDDLPIGYAKLKYPSTHAELADPNAAQLQKIYVLRAFLGRRAGIALLRSALAVAAAPDASTVWLTVLRENTRAIAFYRDAGFAEIGVDTFTIGAQRFTFSVMARHRALP